MKNKLSKKTSKILLTAIVFVCIASVVGVVLFFLPKDDIGWIKNANLEKTVTEIQLWKDNIEHGTMTTVFDEEEIRQIVDLIMATKIKQVISKPSDSDLDLTDSGVTIDLIFDDSLVEGLHYSALWGCLTKLQKDPYVLIRGAENSELYELLLDHLGRD